MQPGLDWWRCFWVQRAEMHGDMEGCSGGSRNPKATPLRCACSSGNRVWITREWSAHRGTCARPLSLWRSVTGWSWQCKPFLPRRCPQGTFVLSAPISQHHLIALWDNMGRAWKALNWRRWGWLVQMLGQSFNHLPVAEDFFAEEHLAAAKKAIGTPFLELTRP